MSDDLVKRLLDLGDRFSKCRDRDTVLEAAAEVKALTAERDRLRALLSEADRRIVWEANGFGSDFADRVQSAVKGETP